MFWWRLVLTFAEILFSMSHAEKNVPLPIGDNKRVSPSIWLALSGGGLRAAIFHYGCLKRMHEVGAGWRPVEQVAAPA